jgi:hypothetical protein
MEIITIKRFQDDLVAKIEEFPIPTGNHITLEYNNAKLSEELNNWLLLWDKTGDFYYEIVGNFVSIILN